MTLASGSAVLRHAGIVLLTIAIGVSTLTFSWPIGEPSDPRLFREFAGPVLYLSDAVLLTGLTLWAMSWGLRGRPPLRIGPSYVAVPMTVLFTVGLVSTLWAIDNRLALLNGLRLGALFAMYVVFVNEYQRAGLIVAGVLIAFGMLHAAIAIAQIVNDDPLGLTMLGEIVDLPPLSYSIKQGRPPGLGFNPNPVGMLLAVVSMFCFAVFLQSRRSFSARAVLIFPFLVATVGLIATKSRWEIVCWAAAVGLITFLALRSDTTNRPNLRRSVVVLAALLTIIIVASFPVLFDKQARELTPDIFTLRGVVAARELRFEDWNRSLDMIRRHLILGVGLGSYPQAFAMETEPDRWGRNVAPVHDLPLLALAEMGPIGAIAMIMLTASPVVWLMGKTRGRQPAVRHLWFGPIIILVLVGLLEYYLWATQDGRVLLWAVLGLWVGESLGLDQPSQKLNGGN